MLTFSCHVPISSSGFNCYTRHKGTVCTVRLALAGSCCADVWLPLQVLCKNSGSTLGYGFATLMEDADSSSSEEDELIRPMSLSEAVP